MELKEVMQQRVFAIAGDTVNPEKYAAKIKSAMEKSGYTVYAVGKELASFNNIDEEIDIIDLCINPVRGLALIKECQKKYKNIVIQPGAANDEIYDYLSSHSIPYIDGCLLKGLEKYPEFAPDKR